MSVRTIVINTSLAKRTRKLTARVHPTLQEPPFDPVDLFTASEKGAIYDVSNLATLFQDSGGATAVTASGQEVRQLRDLSGNNHHLTATNGPIYTEAAGLKFLRFDGINDIMSKASVDFSGCRKFTMILGLTQNVFGTSARVILEHGTGVTNGGLGLYFGNSTPSGNFGAGIGSNGPFLFNNSGGAASQRTFVAVVEFDPIGSTNDLRIAMRIDGVHVDETVSASNTPEMLDTSQLSFATRGLYLGGRASLSIFAQFDLHAAILIGRELSLVELKNAQDWCASRCAVSVIDPVSDVSWTHGLTPSAWTDSLAAVDDGARLVTAPYARAVLTTTATEIEVTSHNDVFSVFPNYARLGVFVNGVYNQSVRLPANGVNVNRIQLPAGSKTVQIVNGLQSRPNAALPVIGSFLKSLRSNAEMTQTFPAVTNRLLIYGDSISVGSDASPIAEKAWVQQVRTASGSNSVALEGWGFRSLHEDAADSTKRAAFVAKLAAYAPAKIWLAIGTNDYGLNKWSAASFGAAYAALLDDLRAALPATAIYCQTPLLRTTETANASGSTLANYRSQIATAVSSRTAFATLVDGTAIMTTASLVDGIHPTTAGHNLYAAAVISQLGI